MSRFPRTATEAPGLESIVDFILSKLEFWGYWIVLGVTFLENSAFIGLIMPGDVTLLVAGLLASRGVLSLPWLIVLASLGAVAGDSTGYLIGRYGGIKFIRRFGRYFHFKEDYLAKAQRYFDSHGGKTIFVGRFATGIKSFIPLAAGVSRMPYGLFLLYNVIASVINVVLLLVLGYFFGQSWQLISHYIGVAGSVILVLAIVAAAAAWYIHRRRQQGGGSGTTGAAG